MKQQICAGGFIQQKNKFLFGKRSLKKKWCPGLWDIPGGRALKNEHPLFTLRRELEEETGIIVMDAHLINSVQINGENDSFIYHIYWVTSYKGKPENLTKEHTDIRWFTQEQMKAVPLALPVYLDLVMEHGKL